MRRKVVAVLQARMSSTRLPGKVLMPVTGRPMLELLLERLMRSSRLDKVVVATSDRPDDEPIAELCARLGRPCYRGSLENVLERIVGAGREQGATDVIRLTADCPLLDPGLIDDLVDFYIKTGADYSSNCLDRTLPDGLDAEAVTMAALEKALAEAENGYELEHVTPYIRNHPEIFQIESLTYEPDLSELRWTVDYREDLEFVGTVFENIYPEKPDFTYEDVLNWLRENPGAGRRQEDAQGS